MIDVNTLLQVAEQQRDLLLVKRGSLQQDKDNLDRMYAEAQESIYARYKADVESIRVMFHELLSMKQRDIEEMDRALCEDHV